MVHFYYPPVKECAETHFNSELVRRREAGLIAFIRVQAMSTYLPLRNQGVQC